MSTARNRPDPGRPDARPGPARAFGRRPRAVLVDLFGTVLRVTALRSRFVEVGRPEHECDLFVAYAVRDGLAFALSGPRPSFARVARDAMRSATGHKLSDEALAYLLEGLETLPPHADAEIALAALATARVPVWAILLGSGRYDVGALDVYGLRTYLRGVLATDDIGAMPPEPAAYLHCCDAVRIEVERTAFVSANAWAVHGAVRAGLIGGLATRGQHGAPGTFELPHVVAEGLDQVVDRLLQLPA